MSKKPVIIGLLVTGVIMMAILSAGCIGAFSYLPDEVKVHGNIISVDSSSVPEETINQLLLSPNEYKSSLVSAIDTYLPKSNSVLEIGAKFGVITAYLNDNIYKNSASVIQVAVEPNPEHFKLLQQTIKNNDIVLDAMQEYVHYPAGENVQYEYTTGYTSGLFSTSGYTTSTPYTSVDVTDIILNSPLMNKTNISLIIDDDTVSKSLFVYEPSLSNYVEYIIMNVSDSSLVKGIIKLASSNGYTNINYPVAGNDNCTVLVFKRIVDPVLDTTVSNDALENLTAELSNPETGTPLQEA